MLKEKTMKRRITALLLSAAMCLSLCACGGEEVKLAVGETASTDIAEFTLEDAQFAYYLNDGTLIPTDESNTMYAASTGHCFVSLTFTLTNNDRGGHLSFCDPFSEDQWKPNFVLEYEGKEYPVNSYTLNDKDGETFSMKYTRKMNSPSLKRIFRARTETCSPLFIWASIADFVSLSVLLSVGLMSTGKRGLSPSTAKCTMWEGKSLSPV